ncbi:yjeF C-terminal region, hydroxyethylthiazole kinase-related [Abditibacterium utsteinense]|uniref:ADP-dependent (S)-NAD(P)H-hydrate dehydratase n=1 Tax=Abditibacterium utsteinense TaxID=1960156 RepID=A0A2S8SUC9_9BACT|nr:NAD(P)H-hydrate dehydratase [Abditibacterium utsteinense]PQV64359.1 yjeF C-terminal region, hydroxyethylthiazole kinase-related [Abditibacterium utsteinense]
MDFQKLDLELLKTMPLPDWSDETAKNERGKLLIIGGSARLPGAILLAARAALRSGCGTVRVAAPASVALHIGIAVPELMMIPLPETKSGTIAKAALEILSAQFKACQAIILGPGLDENHETDEFARELIASAPLPMVVDAQALVALGTGFKTGDAPRILTPHAAEFEALSGQKIGEDKIQIARDFAEKSGATLVLKGHETIVSTKNEATIQNSSGSRALGTAGSGDVLAGIIGGLLAQGLSAHQAAIWGVYFHAQAGEEVAKDLGDDGVMARDFIERLPGIQKFARRTSSPDKKSGFGLRRN